MSYIARMALRNLTRNTRRSVLSALAIVIALALIVFAQGFIRGMLDQTADNTARLKTGHLRIADEDYLRQERLLPLSEAIDAGPELDSIIAGLPGVRASSKRIRFGVLLDHDGNNVPAMGLGIEPEAERDILRLQEVIAEGQYLSGAGDELLMGRGLANKLGIGVGDTLVLITQTAYGSPTGANLLVRGIVESGVGQLDGTHFFISLTAARRLLDLENRASEVILMLDDPGRASVLAGQLRQELADAGYEGVAVLGMKSDPIMAYMSMAEAIYFIIYLVILLVASTAIINTMLMVVFERTREIGMMKALGMSERSVLGVLVLESGFIGLAGSIAGVLLGSALVLALAPHGVDFSSAMGGDANPTLIAGLVHPQLTALAVVVSFLLGLVLSLAVGVMAARQAGRLSPAEALRTI
ncbi:ABC transporter permease [candidate division WOR-3 bacterium]|nr:ABC transporter permease [candidate division WOR-3 bacterium]